jgi:hypothetical protein
MLGSAVEDQNLYDSFIRKAIKCHLNVMPGIWSISLCEGCTSHYVPKG